MSGPVCRSKSVSTYKLIWPSTAALPALMMHDDPQNNDSLFENKSKPAEGRINATCLLFYINLHLHVIVYIWTCVSSLWPAIYWPASLVFLHAQAAQTHGLCKDKDEAGAFLSPKTQWKAAVDISSSISRTFSLGSMYTGLGWTAFAGRSFWKRNLTRLFKRCRFQWRTGKKQVAATKSGLYVLVR